MSWSKASKAGKPPDPRGRFHSVYNDLTESAAWKSLSRSARECYGLLAKQYNSMNNGNLSLPFSYAKKNGIGSRTTLAKGLRALRAVGIIRITRKGGADKHGQRLTSLYRLTEFDTHRNDKYFIEGGKPTNEWRKVQSVEQGHALIAQMEDAEKSTKKTKTVVQKADHTGPQNGEKWSQMRPSNGLRLVEPRQKLDLGLKDFEYEIPTLARPYVKK